MHYNYVIMIYFQHLIDCNSNSLQKPLVCDSIYNTPEKFYGQIIPIIPK